MSSYQGQNGGRSPRYSPPSQQSLTAACPGYPRLNVGHTGPTQTPSDYYIVREQAPPLRRTTLLTYPQTAPHYEPQRAAYTPKPNFGLPNQGLAYNAYIEPALQRSAPLLRASSHYLPQQATNNFHGNHVAYPPLRSGVSAYMPQQGSASESSTMRHAQRWIEIANGGVDISQSLPSMGDIIDNKDIIVQFPDGTIKDVRTHGHVVTHRRAAKAVKKWYTQNTGRSGSLLKGFRVVNGVYIAHIV
ncbi:hypothetical protein BDZ89DRAFT_1047075 [Hymenopellis radicata]|nr:hypothetical protein BDZ89DRAFT_1047075 [Hymenopellis radicata]